MKKRFLKIFSQFKFSETFLPNQQPIHNYVFLFFSGTGFLYPLPNLVFLTLLPTDITHLVLLIGSPAIMAFQGTALQQVASTPLQSPVKLGHFLQTFPRMVKERCVTQQHYHPLRYYLGLLSASHIALIAQSNFLCCVQQFPKSCSDNVTSGQGLKNDPCLINRSCRARESTYLCLTVKV